MKTEKCLLSGLETLIMAGLLMLASTSSGYATITALWHYDGNTSNAGLSPDAVLDPNFQFSFGNGPGSNVVTPAAGQPGFGGALVSTPERATIYQSFNGSPIANTFAAQGTVEFWTKFNTPGGLASGQGQALVSHQGDFFGGSKGLQLFIFNNGFPDDGGQLMAWWVDNGGNRTLNNSPSQPSGDPQLGSTAGWALGSWHHIAFTWSPSLIQLYLDGGRVANATPLGTQPFQNALWVAGLQNGQGFDGSIDELAIWNEVRYTGTTYTVPLAPFVVPVPEPGTMVLLGLGLGLTRICFPRKGKPVAGTP